MQDEVYLTTKSDYLNVEVHAELENKNKKTFFFKLINDELIPHLQFSTQVTFVYDSPIAGFRNTRWKLRILTSQLTLTKQLTQEQ